MRWAAAVLLAGTNCVSGTVYQRATSLQETPSVDEVRSRLADENWKLRCLAAQACGRSPDAECLKTTAALLTSDKSSEVRACASDAMVERCNTGGRTLLVEVAATIAEGPLRSDVVDEVAEVITECPSADALWALVGSVRTRGALRKLGLEETAPKSASDRYEWLQAIAKFPPPRDAIETHLHSAAKAALEARAAAQRAATEEKAREEARLAIEAQERAAREKRDEEARAAFEKRWGSFAAWSARSENRAAVATLKRMLVQEHVLRKLTGEYDEEVRTNDEKVREPEIVRMPLFPETTGAFTFVKILDRYAGEALFSASDGMFVLRLSPGDSFEAYAFQNVRMTMHTRGERVSMTTGARLPVFWSGSAPAKTKVIPGFKPNRSKENALKARVRALTTALERDRFRMLQPTDGDERKRFAAAPVAAPMFVVLDGEQMVKVVVTDPEDESEIYCLFSEGQRCSRARESIPLDSLTGGPPNR